jgi:hypothetical protein
MKKLAAILCLTLAVLLAGSWAAQASDHWFEADVGKPPERPFLPCEGDEDNWHYCTGSKTEKNGFRYVGEYRYGFEGGEATITWPNGKKFVGTWRGGLHEGTMTFPSGDTYVGKFSSMVFWGKDGTYTYANGDKYVGDFVDGKRQGTGTYTFANGTVQEGLWENGEPVSSSQATSDEAELFVIGDLVKDLRSGKSDVRASSTSGDYVGVIQFWREMKSEPDFKATVDAQSSSV